MAKSVPGRNTQIQRVADFIDDPENEGRDLKEVARTIIDGIYGMWMRGIEDPPVPVHLGMQFRSPHIVSKVFTAAWMGQEFPYESREMVWIVEPGSDYGQLTTVDDPFWRIVMPYTPNKPKVLVNADGWVSGDKLSLIQRLAHFEIIAIGERTVLMRDLSTGVLQVDKNANLKKFYNKEK